MFKKKSILAIYSVMMIIIASFINNFFANQINWDIFNQQNSLFYDAYYYWQQGASYNDLVSFKFDYGLLSELSPTLNSIGVVYVNSILYGLGLTIKQIPILMGIVYISLYLLNFKKVDYSIGLIYTSLLPINYLCSKESLIFIGLIFCTSWMIEKKLWKLILGLFIIFISRNELFYIIIIGYFIQLFPFKKIITLIILLGLWFYFKDQSLLSEKLLGENDSLVFGGAFSYVMVGSDLPNMTIIMSRIVVSALLPFKWLISLPLLNNYNNPVWLLTDLTSFITLFCSIFMWIKIRRSGVQVKPLAIQVLKYSTFIYICVYSIIIFHQPTRQILFVLTSYFFVYSTFLVNKNNR
jgi:hypothetical protein